MSRLDHVIITQPHLDHIDDTFNFDALDAKVISHPKHLTEDDIWANNREAD